MAAQLTTASLPTIVATGLGLGLVHVLTGPDHLSALIVLSAGSSWRSCQLGMRWGCGHSLGLIVVTAIFLAVHKQFDVDRFGNYCDFCVGWLMIALGVWSFVHYWRRRPHHATSDRKPSDSETSDARERFLESQTHAYAHISGIPHSHTTGASKTTDEVESELQPLLNVDTSPTPDTFNESTSTCCGLVVAPRVDIKNAQTQRLTALLYGLAHGLAGTGGILGVIPAVVLNDWIKSWAYLLSFCLSSIVTMGAFAALYGELTGRIVEGSDRLLFRVGIFSSSISLLVGVTWVILVSMGKLDEVFG